jgi:CheY-like chemotaxis protein
MARTINPDAITLGVMMPERGGFDVLVELKATSETRDIPVALVAVDDSREPGLALRALDFLVKPVDKDRLLQVLDSVQSDHDGRNTRILIVDDKSHEARLISEILRSEGYEVMEAGSGEKGVELALAEQPDVIILDLIMCDMTGIEAVDMLKEQPEIKKTPIIIYAGKDLTEGDVKRLRTSVRAISNKSGGKQALLEHLDHVRRGQRQP